jgi:hypothetical protein
MISTSTWRTTWKTTSSATTTRSVRERVRKRDEGREWERGESGRGERVGEGREVRERKRVGKCKN